MKYLFYLLFAFMARTTVVQAQVFCTNQTAKGVWIAVAYNYLADATWDWKRDTWRSEGWLYIAPLDTVQLTTHLGYTKDNGIITNLFYYAYQPDGRYWGGSRKFLADVNPPDINPTQYAYRIDDANHIRDPQTNPNVQILLFKAGTNVTDNGTFVLTLRQNDENDPPVNHDKESDSIYDNRTREQRSADKQNYDWRY